MKTAPSYPSAFTGPCHHLRLTPGARRLVIFFGAKDLSFEKYNFFQTGRELPEHCLFLNNGVNQWYQYGVPGLGGDFAQTCEMLARWRDALGVEEVCTIGTSMGGYGAIQYGAVLGARVLAFAVDAQLGSKHSQSKQHFIPAGPPSCADLCDWLRRHPADVTLFAGERDAPDLHSAWQLAQVPGVRAISLVGSDHIVPSHLARRARLAPLLAGFVRGDLSALHPDAGQALEAPDYVAASFAAFDAASTRNWARCAREARRALKVYPYGEAASLLLARALIKQDKMRAAVTTLSGVCATRPEDMEAKGLLATALRKLGAFAQAGQLHQQILAQNPGAHRSHYALGLVHLHTGAPAAAEASVRQALALAPDVAAYADRLEKIKRLRARDKPEPAKAEPPANRSKTPSKQPLKPVPKKAPKSASKPVSKPTSKSAANPAPPKSKPRKSAAG